MAKQQMNIRLDEVHQELLEKLITAFANSDVKTNKTDMIQRSIYAFAKQIIGKYNVQDVVDKHYSKNLKE